MQKRIRIRLTGRRQIPRSTVDAKLFEIGEKRIIGLSIAHNATFERFPADARVKLRLFENKFSETLAFGTVGALKSTAELKNRSFAAPACQLRVVASEGEKKGLLLGSTGTWTLLATDDDQDGNAGKGILMFQPKEIGTRTWKLEIRDDDYPIVYLNSRIPESRTWVRNNPVFVSCVLTAIIREIFDDILVNSSEPDVPWIKDWLRWADELMPTKDPPFDEERVQKQQWTEDLLDSFCLKHGALDLLVGHLNEGFADDQV